MMPVPEIDWKAVAACALADLEKAHQSGKAARELAIHAMEAAGMKGAHVVLRIENGQLRLVVCAPPSDDEQALAKQIISLLRPVLPEDAKIGDAGKCGVCEP